jgi:cobalt/nickel transport system permease protein
MALDRWDPRLRILTAVAWALVVVALQHPLSLLCAFAAILIPVAWLGLASRALLRRLMPLEIFMLLLLLTLPFTLRSGEIWFQFGPLTAYWSGLERAAGVVLKANSVVLAVFLLVGTLSPAELSFALSRLHMPMKLVLLLQFTLRYIGVLQHEYQRLRRAMKARAFSLGSDRHSLRSLGWLVGMLLVRTLERSERVLAAMKCRGFEGRPLGGMQRLEWQPADSGRAILLAAAFGAVLAVDRVV